MTVEFGQFKYGGASYPLPTSTVDPLLKNADPSLYYVLDYFRSVLTKYMGDRLIAETLLPPAITAIQSPIQAVLPYDPTPFMQEQQMKFPLLAVYRKKDKFNWHTIAYHDDVSEWCVDYILPPLTSGQMERVAPILRTIGAILQNRIENMYDPFYQSGLLVWEAAGLEEIKLEEASYGNFPAGNLFFPAWRGKLMVKETNSFDAADAGLGPLAGIDLEEDAAGSPTLPIVEEKIDF